MAHKSYALKQLLSKGQYKTRCTIERDNSEVDAWREFCVNPDGSVRVATKVLGLGDWDTKEYSEIQEAIEAEL